MKSCQTGGLCCNVSFLERRGGDHDIKKKEKKRKKSWGTSVLPPPDISIFTLRELLSRLLAPVPSDMHAIPAEDELFPKEPGIRQSWNVTPLTTPFTHTHTHTPPTLSSGSLSDHYLHNYMLSSEEKTNPQILRVN